MHLTLPGTEENPGNFGGTDHDVHSLNAGAPHVWINGTANAKSISSGDGTGDDGNDDRRLHGVDTIAVGDGGAGLGLVALDDIFRVHAECRNFAVRQLNPRVPASCPVASPPAVRLADPRFALPAGESHTLEWAVYLFNASCNDFFCLVNALRHDYGTEEIVIGLHTGVLSAMENGANAEVDDMTQWARSGYVLVLQDYRVYPPRYFSNIVGQTPSALVLSGMHVVGWTHCSDGLQS